MPHPFNYLQNLMSESNEKDTKGEVVNFEVAVDLDDEVLKVVEDKDADVTLNFFIENDSKVGPLTPEAEKKLVRKIHLKVFLVICAISVVLFLDKYAMSYSNLLGLWPDTGLDQNRYNNLQTFYYVGYMVSQVPSHYAFQKVKLSTYMTVVTFFWAFLQLIQLTADSYWKMILIRLFLGVFEAGVTPALEHTIAMWFTPDEQAIVNAFFWITCMAQGIPGGLITYGVQYIPNVRPWKVYWGIIGGLSFILSLNVFFFYPDNPATYKYMTVEERVHVIRRVKAATNSSIEQKVVKRSQVIETLKDPISWLFVVFIFALMMCNNISFSSNVIYTQLGFSHLQSTLVSVATSVWSTINMTVGALILTRYRLQSVYVSVAWTMMSLLGGILVIALPLSDSYGILAGIMLANTTGMPYILGFSWSQSSAAGYTKRLVRTIMWSISYGVVDIIAPQIWRSQDAPRYYMAWGILIGASWVLAPIIMLTIRYILSRRNKERRQLLQDIADGKVEDETGYVTTIDEDGNVVKEKVDISMLDLTDLQNKKFIYPL